MKIEIQLVRVRIRTIEKDTLEKQTDNQSEKPADRPTDKQSEVMRDILKEER